MSTYGQFESERQFSDSGQIVLFDAHSKDASDAKEYIVRVFKNTTGDPKQLEYFLSNSRAQASLTQQNQAKHWAPVVAVDSTGAQGYNVQPKYESNLEDFGRSRFLLTDEILRHFVKGIIAGLKEAEALGPHGNLKPTNVLLEAPGKWSEATIRLTDAHFHRSATIKPEEDFKALARIVYFLVVGKEPASSLQRVSAEETWSFEKGDASGWKEFCNQLLADTGTLTLADVQQLLDQVPVPAKRTNPTKIAFIVLLVCCMLGIGFWAIYQTQKEEVLEFVPEHSIVQWQTLVNDYNLWLQTVESSIEQAESGVEEMQFWMQDEYLKKTVLQWYRKKIDGGVLINPWLIIDKKLSPKDISPKTTPGVLRKVQYLKRLEESHLFVEELRRRIKEWPAPANLQAISKEFEAFGLKGPADEIVQIVEQYDRDFDKDLVEQLKLIHETERQAKLLSDNCGQLLKRSAALSKLGQARDGLPEDKVLTKLVDYIENSWATVNSLAALQDTIKLTSQQIGSLEDTVGSEAYRTKIDLKLFREQSEVNRTDTALSAKTIQDWLDEAPQYARLSDEENPLRPKLWEEEKNKVQAVVAELIKVKNEMGLEGDDLNKALAALDAIEKGQNALFEKQDRIRQMPAIVKLSQELDSLNVQTLKEWDSLLLQARELLLEIRPDPDEWLANIRADTIPNDEILNREWILRRDALLEATPRSQWEADMQVFGLLRGRLRQVRNFLSGLSGEQMLSAAKIPSQGIDGPVHERLELFLKELRDESFNRILQGLTDEVIEETDATRFIAAPEQQETLKYYETLKSETVQFGQDVRTVKAALARGESYGELPEVFWNTWREHTALKRLRNDPVIKTLVDQFEALEQLYENPSTDPATLLALVENKETPLANAILAWRQLDKAGNWPGTANEFESDVSALRVLLEREDMTLGEALIEAGRQRWLKRFKQAKSNQELETAFRFLPEYRVEPAQLNPFMHFHYFVFSELSALRSQTNLSRVGGNTVAGWKSELLTRIKENQQWSELDQAKILIERLEAFQPGEEAPPLPSTELGPGLKDWKVVKGEVGDEAITYQWESVSSRRVYQIDFIKVEMLDLCYMSRAEVSMGLFRDWVEQAPDWEQWYDLISEIDIINGFELRAGPRTWEVMDQSLKVPEDGWLYPLPGWPDTLYFSGYQGGSPTDDHPMQYVPPEFALKFALSLNCTLPTPDQWNEVLNGHTDLSPNRRDPSWLNQKKYVAENFSINRAWPDTDSFSQVVDPSVPTGMAAKPVTNVADDGKVWFSKVDDGASGSQFSHLSGNVAEYLYDGTRFYVGGASALSAPSIEPSGVYPLDRTIPMNGFSDVGIRLVFVVTHKLPGREFKDLLEDYYSQF